MITSPAGGKKGLPRQNGCSPRLSRLTLLYPVSTMSRYSAGTPHPVAKPPGHNNEPPCEPLRWG